jgi:hypothetical protein
LRYLSLALGCLLPALFYPLGIGHLPTRRQPAHPGTMRALGKIHGNSQLARRDRQTMDMVHMLVGHDDRIQRFRLLSGQAHASEQLTAAQPGIHQNPRPSTGDNRAVTLGTRRKHREAHHGLSIPRIPY